MAHTILGSDHSPLVLSSGEELRKRSSRFFFEKGWLERPEFVDLVSSKWRRLEESSGTFADPIDAWQFLSAGIRQFLKGWGANLGKADRELKEGILAQIQTLDHRVDPRGWMTRVGRSVINLKTNSPTLLKWRRSIGVSVADRDGYCKGMLTLPILTPSLMAGDASARSLDLCRSRNLLRTLETSRNISTPSIVALWGSWEKLTDNATTH
jgi:hypothetical protein